MEDDFETLAKRVSNWGRWGKDDQRGTLNLITPEVLKRAGREIRQGKLFRLGLDFADDGPQSGRPSGERHNPHHYMTKVSKPFNPALGDYAMSDDVIHMHLQASTQWDGLAHVQYGGKLYNGFKAAEVLSSAGASRLGVEHAASPGVMSRGVLLDIARLNGVDRLPTDFLITPDHLEAACKSQRVSMESGDIVLVRTGHITWFKEDKDYATFRLQQPGLSMGCALWLRDRNVAAVCADNAGVELMKVNYAKQGPVPLPLHMLCLRDMGLQLGELFDLEALAEDCAQDGVYTFLLSAPVLPVRGGVGSPINPLALK